MTQKDLAERLNVSDKTVSRWERDDGAPDLAAILLSRKSLALPVMSCFGVSGSHLKNVPWFQRRMRPPQKVRNSASVY